MTSDAARDLLPIILCGGGGVRLWPLSRQLLPKQFMELPGGGTLLGDLLSSLGRMGCKEVVYVAAAEHVSHCLAAHNAAMPGCACEVIAEPEARNTAAAIATATWHVQATRGGDKICMFLPADHAIAKRDVFNGRLVRAGEVARRGKVVTLGIEPRAASTQFGYIKGRAVAGEDWLEVEEFSEKPGQELADEWFAQKERYWNAGVFVATAATLGAEFAEHAPQVAAAAGRQALAGEDGVLELDAQAYAKFPRQSFDRAIMEKTSRAAMLPVEGSGWTDVGTWDSFRQVMPADEGGNRSVGETKLVRSDGVAALAGSGRLVAIVGCQGINVIDTPDVVLVAGGDSAAGIRELHEQLADDERLVHPVSERKPWGRYAQLGRGEGWKVKRIEVDPGRKLSLQSHEHRAETWVVVAGVMTVTVDGVSKDLQVGESCVIPQGARHRMANNTDSQAVLVEVQSGDYLGEDDITRYEDDFGRSR